MTVTKSVITDGILFERFHYQHRPIGEVIFGVCCRQQHSSLIIKRNRFEHIVKSNELIPIEISCVNYA